LGIVLVKRFARELQQCHVASLLYRHGDFALMFGAGAGLAARADFALTVHKTG
jgi:hypothetical protein